MQQGNETNLSKKKKIWEIHKFNHIISPLAMILLHRFNKKQKCYRIYMEKIISARWKGFQVSSTPSLANCKGSELFEAETPQKTSCLQCQR